MEVPKEGAKAGPTATPKASSPTGRIPKKLTKSGPVPATDRTKSTDQPATDRPKSTDESEEGRLEEKTSGGEPKDSGEDSGEDNGDGKSGGDDEVNSPDAADVVVIGNRNSGAAAESIRLFRFPFVLQASRFRALRASHSHATFP